MTALDIQPHSRRISSFAIVGLSVVAAGAFAAGLSRQINRSEPAPYVAGAPPSAAALAAAAAPEATPAPDMQISTSAPVKRHGPPLLDLPAPDSEAAATPAASDASATVAAPPVASPPVAPPPPEPAPETADPPT
jgi:hypothetical protein